MTPVHPFYANGLAFGCTRCSACCRHDPGYVFLSRKDLAGLASHMGMGEAEFRAAYCRVVDFGVVKRLSLIEKPNVDCIFWEETGCSVYAARPLQCRSFPFWGQTVDSREDWDLAGEDCPGINHGPIHSRETIEAWLRARRLEPLLED